MRTIIVGGLIMMGLCATVILYCCILVGADADRQMEQKRREKLNAGKEEG